MTQGCKVSVVIPCFNHGEFLADAVESVTSAGRDDVELIVVDDGSTDERTHAEMTSLCGRGIHVIRQQNRGLAAARNAAIANSRGEYILPLDADNRLRPAYFEHGIRILDSHPRVGIVYGDAEYIGERTGRWSVGTFQPERLLERNFIDACAIYRRTIWEQNEGYDGTMPVQGLEDWDFWLGALDRDWQFAYVPEVLFEYRVAKESMITRARGYEERVHEFVAKKHGPLYRRALLSALTQRDLLLQQRRSVRWTIRNLGELLKSRLKQRLHSDA